LIKGDKEDATPPISKELAQFIRDWESLIIIMLVSWHAIGYVREIIDY
jgi:hypothetical protein